MRLLGVGMACWLGSWAGVISAAAIDDSPKATVLAFLGEQPITQAHVDFLLGRPQDAPQVALAEATIQQAIQLIAQQRQALQTLRQLDLTADADAVSRTIAGSDSGQSTSDAVLKEIHERFGISEEFYRDQVAFRLSWKRYLAKHLTPENLAKHFDNQPARFDGTRFEIWRVSRAVPAGASTLRTQAAQELRTFSQQAAALEDSEVAQLAENANFQFVDAHWIRGFGDGDPAVVSALLELQPGEMTSVFHTATGVHLAKLSRREPGTREFEAARAEVRMHVLVFLLDHLAQQSAGTLQLIPNLNR